MQRCPCLNSVMFNKPSLNGHNDFLKAQRQLGLSDAHGLFPKMSYLVHSKFEIGAYHLNSLLLSYQKSFKLDHQTSTYIYLYLCLLLKSELSFMMYVHVHTPLPLTGHSRVYSVLVGTNQGSVLGYSVDMPSGRHRDSRSPIIMPIGDYRSHQGGHMHACTCSCLNLIGRWWIVGNMCMYMYENKSGSLYDNSSRSSYHIPL